MGLRVLLALVYVVLFASMVGDETPARTGAGTNDGTLGTADEASDDSAADGRATDDFGLGVVAGVMVVLLAPGLVVGLLAECMEGCDDPVP